MKKTCRNFVNFVQPFMISLIVPAHNEQAVLGQTLEAIHAAAQSVGRAYEIIVVNDASTDATADIALRHNARVVFVNHRQIAATRNSGGKAALGERLFFVDADTKVNSKAVTAALRAMDKGAVGGGGPAWWDKNETVPLYVRLMAILQIFLVKFVRFTGGAFMFCTREAFRATGGFNERLYWAEEIDFILKLKREGRFTVLWTPVLTSGRRFRTTSPLQIFGTCAKAVFMPRTAFTKRASVEKIWYDSNRDRDNEISNSLLTRIFNAFALVVLLVMITSPVWDFIPWSATPLDTPLGKMRFVITIFLCHIGLLLWPLAFILFLNLIRQKRWTGVFHSTALIALCTWQGWNCTQGVIWIWSCIACWTML